MPTNPSPPHRTPPVEHSDCYIIRATVSHICGKRLSKIGKRWIISIHMLILPKRGLLFLKCLLLTYYEHLAFFCGCYISRVCHLHAGKCHWGCWCYCLCFHEQDRLWYVPDEICPVARVKNALTVLYVQRQPCVKDTKWENHKHSGSAGSGY